ncbi:MAG: hypothetical protein JW797_04960 [Bradymonadales bacterium]|nr:hypothetical protein [Bradymonadales bacterium]
MGDRVPLARLTTAPCGPTTARRARQDSFAEPADALALQGRPALLAGDGGNGKSPRRNGFAHANGDDDDDGDGDGDGYRDDDDDGDGDGDGYRDGDGDGDGDANSLNFSSSWAFIVMVVLTTMFYASSSRW